ncbi:MAG TPA: carboxypeptidase-like regulatory domain-containing protein, partial [Puia sp.]
MVNAEKKNNSFRYSISFEVLVLKGTINNGRVCLNLAFLQIFGLFYKLIYICIRPITNAKFAGMFSRRILILKCKKGIILGLILLFTQCCPELYAQTQISGIIRDTKGHALPGASISVKGSFDGATSDSSGIYSFNCADTGLQTLKVSSVGYRSIEVTLQMTGKSVK